MLALVVISFIIWRLAVEGRRINEALVRTREILEEKRRITALGALAAAAVHELGSPLGTIAVVTREMERDTHPDDPLAEDITLLKNETEKCKKILADLARNPDKTAYIPEPQRLDRMLIEIASEQIGHVQARVHSRVPDNLPFLEKTPNLDYGLGNLIGNAKSFAKESVDISVEGWAERIEIVIQDDGPGFSEGTLQAVGQPYISTRASRQDHLGLGIFISINLLEATGATLSFMNAQTGGAMTRIVWPRSALEAGSSES